MGRRWDCERSADPASSLTVVLDERDRPVACWDLGGAYPESLYAGFFEWSPAKGQEHFLAQAIILEQAGDEIYGVMYRITQLRLGEPSTEPVLVVPVVHRWVDSRESQPKIAEGGLPAGLEGLVRISEE